ncbi:MAG: 3'(2'),5'-bisphosphate nucleotidase CysQ, partial [Limisphaerales bacterium]
HLGLVYVPAKKLFYWAEAGMGAFKQAEGGAVERIQTRKPHADALDIVASRDHAGPMVADLLHRFPTAQTR